jgi:hypothetical protein
VRAEVKQGHELFFGKAACVQCHVGSRFTDNNFHNIGIGWDEKTRRLPTKDAIQTTNGHRCNEGFGEAIRGAFKTPDAALVTSRAPYMHDGSVATLREGVEYYNRGGQPESVSRSEDAAEASASRPPRSTRSCAMMKALDGDRLRRHRAREIPEIGASYRRTRRGRLRHFCATGLRVNGPDGADRAHARLDAFERHAAKASRRRRHGFLSKNARMSWHALVEQKPERASRCRIALGTRRASR